MTIDWLKVKTIYCIGIKGVGMTMLSQFLKNKGYQVSGSDLSDTFMTDQVLAAQKISVREGFAVNDWLKSADLIIYSTAYGPDNPEVAWALEYRQPLIYAQALGQVFNQYYGVAVTGTHGKTTVSAWLGFVLKQARKQPNVLVGARVPQFSGASLIGQSSVMVIEADEYQNKLQYFQPKIVLLNNVDYDHVDFYPTRQDYQQAFVDFLKKIPSDGYLIANYDDPVVRQLASAYCRGQIISYALNYQADYIGYGQQVVNGRQYFKVKIGSNDFDIRGSIMRVNKLNQKGLNEISDLGDFSTSLLGDHSVSNALAVLAASIELGVPLYQVREGLAEFTGTARRLEVLGQFKGAIIIDDYAHHPTEIKASLIALRQKYPDQQLRVFFHPHTFSRTKAFLNDFVNSFQLADEVGILKIYGSAREEGGGISGQELTKFIADQRPNQQLTNYFDNMDSLYKYLRQSAEKGQIIVVMGAGDIFRVAQRLLSK